MSYTDKAKKAAAQRKYNAKKKAEDPVAWSKLKVSRAMYYAKRNPEKVRALGKCYRARNAAAVMVRQAQQRARRQGLACDLKVGDVVIPTHCPVLGMLLARGPKHNATSPSLDRIKPELGYVKGNVRVISWRANCLKRDGALEEFIAIVAYMRGEL